MRHNGHVLEMCLPVNARWISGFRIPAPPQPRLLSNQSDPLTVRVYVHGGGAPPSQPHPSAARLPHDDQVPPQTLNPQP